MSDRGMRRTLTGTVISDRMEKSIIVQVKRKVKHPLYKKYVVQRKKYKAHDERNECSMGDMVLIRESRPLSKEKRWRVSQVLKKAP